MKYSYIYIIYLFCIFHTGCSPKTLPTETEENNSTNNTQGDIEYNYTFFEGNKQKLLGNHEAAVKYFKRCAEINKQSGAPRFQLSRLYYILGDIDEALYYAREAAGINQENKWYLLQLADMYQYKQKYDSTILVYQKVLEIVPENIDLKYNLALLYNKQKEYQKALEILNEIEKLIGINRNVGLTKEKIYEDLGKYDEAEIELKKLIELFPDNPQYYGILAELYSTIGKDEEAEETYKALFKIDENNGLGQLSIAEFYREKNNYEEAFFYFNKGFENRDINLNTKIQTVFSFLSNEKEAKERKDNILHLIEVLMTASNNSIQIRTLKADFFIRNEEYNNAVLELRFITKKEKNNYVIWEQMIYIENLIGEYDSMYNESNEAIKYFPQQPNLYLYNGIASIQLGKNKEAVETLQKGLNYTAGNKGLLIQFNTFLGEAYHNEKQNDLSDNAFEEVISLDPNNLYVLNNYSYYLAVRKENLERAKELSNRCIKKEPNNSTYLDTYGWILFNLGEYKEAEKIIKRAMESGGESNYVIVEHYGDILYKSGNSDEAKRYWAISKNLGNKSEEIKNKLETGKIIKE